MIKENMVTGIQRSRVSSKARMITPAEAWCWVAHLHAVEDNALTYKYPRTEEDEAEALWAQQRGDAAYARACKLDPSEDLWRRSLEAWYRDRWGVARC